MTKPVISLLVWCHQESNRGHKDFQSFALPSELWHLYQNHKRVVILTSKCNLRFFESGCKGTTNFSHAQHFFVLFLFLLFLQAVCMLSGIVVSLCANK